MEKDIIIYETGGKNVQFNLNPGEETIWATQAQMAELFDVNVPAVVKHLRHIYQDGELEENRTSSNLEIVQKEGAREVRRTVKVYNLDAVISVVYRVNSRKATDFRIWATKVLKRYIVNGAAVNERRLKELSQTELKKVAEAMAVVKRLLAQNELTGAEANGVLEVISQYALTFRTLREYEDGFVKVPEAPKATRLLGAGDCMTMIVELREKIHGGEMFGKPRGDAFEGALRAIYQSFDGEDVYATVAEKAANLLYFVIKDHPFFDGNKRIAVFLFMVFLAMNEYSLTAKGEAKISDRALVAIALMIAESEPREKGLMTAVVCKILE